MELKDGLIAGSKVEKEYLKAKKGLSVGHTSGDLAKVQKEFTIKLSKLDFADIPDYHAKVFSYGHYWRILHPASYPVWTAENIPHAIQESLDTGRDIFAHTVYDRTVALVPATEEAEKLVDVKYCQKEGIDIIPYLGSGGCYITEAGDPGMLLIFHRPAMAEGVEHTLKEVMQTVLFEHYGVETYLETNELMAKQFLAPLYLLPCTVSPPNGIKIWGDSYANLGKVVMVVGALTLEYDAGKAKRILKKRPNHPDIKEPRGLNDLLGYKIDPQEVLRLFLAEWLKKTNSQMANE